MSRVSLLFVAGIFAATACRESLSDTTDLRYEDLIVGMWQYTNSVTQETITLTFSSVKDVHIVNPSLGIDSTYSYFIDAGILYLTTGDSPPEIIFSYVIEELNFSQMILRFSGERQAYFRVRP